MISFKTFKYNVNQWATERKIYSEGTIEGQIKKLKEEPQEVEDAYCSIEKSREDLVLEIGDVFVTAVNLCGVLGIDPREPMEKAWLKIKDRKGEMRNGIYIKEADL